MSNINLWELESLINLKNKLKSILINRNVNISDNDNLDTLVDKVNRIDENVILDSIYGSSLENYYNDRITILNSYSFYFNSSINGNVELPNVINVGQYAFAQSKNIKKVIINKAISIPTQCFNTSYIEELYAREATSLGNQCLTGCGKLRILYVPLASFPGSLCVSGSSNLEYICTQGKNIGLSNSLNIVGAINIKMIIVNSLELITCSSITGFPKTALTEGECYFYVPSSLIESYKTATNWSTYADRFRAIEDYKTEICNIFPDFEEDYVGTWNNDSNESEE